MGLMMHEDEAYPEGDGSGGITDIDEATPSFEEAQTRENIASGDTLSVIFGKIKKFFTDLATVAFSGSYNDLSNKPTIPTKVSQLTNDSGYKTTDHTYNFAGVTFNSGSGGSGEHNCNNMAYNGVYYYNAGGPATSLGMSTNDGATYVQAYNTSWVAQIAQDYRNGSLCVRGRNNGSWSAWKRIIDSSNISVQRVANANYANSAGSAGSSTSAVHSSYVYANSRTTHSSDVNNSFMIANGGHRVTIQQDCNLVVYRNNGSAAWSSGSSSKRFKHNIQSMTRERALKILKIRAVTFDWNDDQVITTQKCDNAGVIAEEVSRVLPDLVVYEAPKGDEERRERRVEYERFTPYLIKMVQIQQEEIDTLKKRIDILEKLVLSKGE